MMDLGATICTPRNPACGLCPLRGWCAASREGEPERYPVKAPKAARPHRHGIAYWLEHDGEVLLVRRPAKGLLGGMLALPEERARRGGVGGGGRGRACLHPFRADHDACCCAEAEARPEGIWWPVDTHRRGRACPTLFAKLAARGLAWREKGKADGGVRKNALLV